jgi:hypothetical protein
MIPFLDHKTRQQATLYWYFLICYIAVLREININGCYMNKQMFLKEGVQKGTRVIPVKTGISQKNDNCSVLRS